MLARMRAKGILALSLIMLAMLLAGCGTEDLGKPITVEARFESPLLYITNQDTSDWTDVELIITPGTYIQRVDVIKAGETIELKAGGFMNKGGDRFAPQTGRHKLGRLTIRCKMNREPAGWSGLPEGAGGYGG